MHITIIKHFDPIALMLLNTCYVPIDVILRARLLLWQYLTSCVLMVEQHRPTRSPFCSSLELTIFFILLLIFFSSISLNLCFFLFFFFISKRLYLNCSVLLLFCVIRAFKCPQSSRFNELLFFSSSWRQTVFLQGEWTRLVSNVVSSCHRH